MKQAIDPNAFSLMRASLERILPVMLTYARSAKNKAAKDHARNLAEQIKEALQAADKACEHQNATSTTRALEHAPPRW